jgi:hypothetical protein
VADGADREPTRTVGEMDVGGAGRHYPGRISD